MIRGLNYPFVPMPLLHNIITVSDGSKPGFPLEEVTWEDIIDIL